MPVFSMTGYACAQLGSTDTPPDTHTTGLLTGQSHRSSSQSPCSLGLEIRSVNSRYLDVSFRLSDELRSCEPALRDLVVRHIKRGKLELRASVDGQATGLISEPSIRLLQRLNALQDNIRTWMPLTQPLSVADVIRLAATDAFIAKDWQSELMVLAQQALTDLMQARQREGDRLVTMLEGRIGQLRELLARAVPMVPQLVAQQRQKFLDRWQEAAGLLGAAVPESIHDRALAEAAAFALRIDIAEELTRMESHLDELSRLLDGGGEIGKRLDFLIQELHREANTLGSKSAVLALTHIAVDMKVLIEQMREQVQNIE